MKMFFFIINPIAGNGKSLKIWEELREELKRKNILYRSFFSDRPGHAEQLTKQVAAIHHEQIEAVVAVGGDGTIHEVINGLSHYSHLKVGYIPAGSGNDFARGFSGARSPFQALELILTKQSLHTRFFDVGDYTIGHQKKRYRQFVNSVGAGFDAEIARVANHAFYKKWLNKIKLGRFAYVIALIQTLITFKPQQVTLKVDGKSTVLDDVWFITVSNTPFYGGGMKISPSADPTDGKFNVTLVKNISRLKLLFLFGSVFMGWHRFFKEVSMFTARDIEVVSQVPFPVHADGEQVGITPYHIKLNSGKRCIYSNLKKGYQSTFSDSLSKGGEG